MITEIPSAADFARASVNLLHLAWETAVGALRTFESEHSIYEDGQLWSPQEALQAARSFWGLSQLQLGNALTLVQQAIEMALKGRIA